MIKQKHLTKCATLVVTFLILNSCSNVAKRIPKITLVQIDANNNMANPFPVQKYDNKTCKMSVVAAKPFVIVNSKNQINPKLNGGFWISAEDMAKLKAFGKTECENAK